MNSLSHFLLTGLALFAGSVSFAQIAGGQGIVTEWTAAPTGLQRPDIVSSAQVVLPGESVRFAVDGAHRYSDVTWQYSLDDGVSFSAMLSAPSLEITRTEPWMHQVQIRVAASLPGSTVFSDPVVLILETIPRDGDHT